MAEKYDCHVLIFRGKGEEKGIQPILKKADG